MIEAALEGVITLQSLKNLRDELSKITQSHPADGDLTLVLDTDQHEFENFTLLGTMRAMLGEFTGKDKKISRIAFITPAQFVRSPESGGNVAFFEKIEDART